MGDQDPKNWAFFMKDFAELDSNSTTETRIRFALNNAHQCKFFYIGKTIPQQPLQQLKHTVVKFSNYEGRRILHWLTPRLDEIDSQQGKEGLIPYFQTEEGRQWAEEMIDKNDRLKFFNHTDLSLATVKVRLVFNSICGEYELYLLNPVSAENSAKHRGWPGPCVILREKAMRSLRRFIVRQNPGAVETESWNTDNEDTE